MDKSIMVLIFFAALFLAGCIMIYPHLEENIAELSGEGLAAGIMVVTGFFGFLLAWQIKDWVNSPEFWEFKRKSFWEKRLTVLAWAIIPAGYFGFKIAQFWTMTLLEQANFFLTVCLLSALFAALWLFVLSKWIPALFSKKSRSESKFWELVRIGATAFILNAAFIIVLTFSTVKEVGQQKVAIMEHGATKNKAFVWVSWQGKKKCLRPSNKDWRACKNQDSVVLVIHKGFFDFEFVGRMLPAAAGLKN